MIFVLDLWGPKSLMNKEDGDILVKAVILCYLGGHGIGQSQVHLWRGRDGDIIGGLAR
jgi:hypothetical protein